METNRAFAPCDFTARLQHFGIRQYGNSLTPRQRRQGVGAGEVMRDAGRENEHVKPFESGRGTRMSGKDACVTGRYPDDRPRP